MPGGQPSSCKLLMILKGMQVLPITLKETIPLVTDANCFGIYHMLHEIHYYYERVTVTASWGRCKDTIKTSHSSASQYIQVLLTQNGPRSSQLASVGRSQHQWWC